MFRDRKSDPRNVQKGDAAPRQTLMPSKPGFVAICAAPPKLAWMPRIRSAGGEDCLLVEIPHVPMGYRWISPFASGLSWLRGSSTPSEISLLPCAKVYFPSPMARSSSASRMRSIAMPQAQPPRLGAWVD